MAFFQAETLWVNQLADGVACLVLDVPGRSVNVLTRQVMTDLDSRPGSSRGGVKLPPIDCAER